MSLTRSSTRSRRDPRADDFDAFYESWFARAVAIAKRKGLRDPEAAAQECMMVFLTKDYLQRHDPDGGASFDTWVANILYRRYTSMQRRELRRSSIAHMSALPHSDRLIGEDFGYEAVHGISVMGDFRDRMIMATEIIRLRHAEWYPLWKSVIMQVIMGNATAGDTVDRRELAARAGMTQKDLEADIDRFIEVVTSDHELADLLGVDRSPVSVS